MTISPLDSLSKAHMTEKDVQDAIRTISDAGRNKPLDNGVVTVIRDAQKWAPASPIKINPQHVRVGRFSNRLPDFFKTPEYENLKNLIRDTQGNTQPALVIETGEVDADNNPIYEVVYGHCRLQACQDLSNEYAGGITKDYLFLACVLPKETPFAVCAKLAAAENKGRNDLTAWEEALWWTRQLDNNEFPNIRSLALNTGEDEKRVSTYVALVRNHDQRISMLLSDPRQLTTNFVRSLIRLRTNSPDVYEKHLERLQSSGKTYTCKELVAAFKSNPDALEKVNFRGEVELVSAKGDTIGRIKRRREGGIQIVVEREVDAKFVDKLQKLLDKHSA